MKISIFLISLINLIFFSTTAFSATTLDGQIDGAYYRIEVPDNWNGDLVVWNHGMDGNEPAPLDVTDLGMLAPLQLSQGYAVAASSYRTRGWALFKSVEDNENLIKTFIENIGSPNNIYMVGGSMGGIISEQYLEKGHVGYVAAAYSVCGVLSGSKNLDAILDLRLTYDAVCKNVPGAAIPGGEDGLPADSTLSEADLIGAIHTCTGILYPAEYRTPEMQARLDKITQVNRINEASLLDNMAYAIYGIADLVNNPEKLDSKNGLWNYFVDYEDDQINAEIKRVFPHPKGVHKLRKNYIPKGNTKGSKLLALSSDKDDLVPVENLSFIEKLMPENDLVTAVSVKDEPGHCGFSVAEVISGWESVRGWVEAGVKPTAQSFQQNCQLMEAAGLATGPCNIDPSFVVNDYDSRIRPRIPQRIPQRIPCHHD
jgi:pimeloyl-ACP methyl ester carboxylesterase